MRNIPLKFSRKKWEVCSMPVLKSFIETLKLTSSILWCVIKYGIKAILCHWSDRELFQFSNMIWAVTKYAFCRRAGMLEILVGTSSSGGHNLPPIPPGQLKKRLKNLVGTGKHFTICTFRWPVLKWWQRGLYTFLRATPLKFVSLNPCKRINCNYI